MIRYTVHRDKEPPNGPYVMDDHVDSGYCGMNGPDGKFTCTRPLGHDGVHEAGARSGPTGRVARAVASWM